MSSANSMPLYHMYVTTVRKKSLKIKWSHIYNLNGTPVNGTPVKGQNLGKEEKHGGDAEDVTRDMETVKDLGEADRDNPSAVNTNNKLCYSNNALYL